MTHIGLPPFGGVGKLVVCATISNSQSGKSIDVNLHVDSGCHFDLMLDPGDILELNLVREGEPIEAILCDGSQIRVQKYSEVSIGLTTDTSEQLTAIVTPVCIVRSDTAQNVGPAVADEDDTSRLLGYNALGLLGVLQDFYRHRLIKYT